MRVAALLGLLALQAVAAIAPVREVDSEAVLLANQPLPGFYDGYTFFVESHNRIKLYSPGGQLVFDTYLRPETIPHVMSIAVDSAGRVAVSYLSRGSGAIDLLDSSGNSLGSIQTGNYLPSHIAFGDDHSIWTFGLYVQGNPGNPKNYMAVRHYSPNGSQTGSFLPRSLFPAGLEPACFGWQEQGIYVASDRIGLLACSGMSSVNPEWVELDMNGNLIGRWQVGTLHKRVALTYDGHVYAQDSANGSRQIFVLERASSGFQPVAWTIPGWLCGAAGDELLFSDWNNGPMHFRWYKQP